MKKTIALLILGALLLPMTSFAYTAQEKATLIAQIQAQLTVLYQEYYALLAQEQGQSEPVLTGNATPFTITTPDQQVAQQVECNPTLTLSAAKTDQTHIQFTAYYTTNCPLDRTTAVTFKSNATDQVNSTFPRENNHGTIDNAWPFSSESTGWNGTAYTSATMKTIPYEYDQSVPLKIDLTVGNVSQTITVYN